MAEKQRLDLNLVNKERETQVNRALCYLDPQISLKFTSLENFLEKKFAMQVFNIKGVLDQRNLLQGIEKMSEKDLFIFFLKIIHGEQINDLYGKWKKISIKQAKSLFVILDCSLPSFRNNTNNLFYQRYQEMDQDRNTKIILIGQDQLNANTFNRVIEELIAN